MASFLLVSSLPDTDPQSTAIRTLTRRTWHVDPKKDAVHYEITPTLTIKITVKVKKGYSKRFTIILRAVLKWVYFSCSFTCDRQVHFKVYISELLRHYLQAENTRI